MNSWYFSIVHQLLLEANNRFDDGWVREKLLEVSPLSKVREKTFIKWCWLFIDVYSNFIYLLPLLEGKFAYHVSPHDTAAGSVVLLRKVKSF